MSMDKEKERLRYVSVGVSFGDAQMLARHGSGAVDLTCPACGARGRRFGNPGEDQRYEGFVPLSAGGLFFVLCECQSCKEQVTLPHRRA
jgi:hypothetical protein